MTITEIIVGVVCFFVGYWSGFTVGTKIFTPVKVIKKRIKTWD